MFPVIVVLNPAKSEERSPIVKVPTATAVAAYIIFQKWQLRKLSGLNKVGNRGEPVTLRKRRQRNDKRLLTILPTVGVPAFWGVSFDCDFVGGARSRSATGVAKGFLAFSRLAADMEPVLETGLEASSFDLSAPLGGVGGARSRLTTGKESGFFSRSCFATDLETAFETGLETGFETSSFAVFDLFPIARVLSPSRSDSNARPAARATTLPTSSDVGPPRPTETPEALGFPRVRAAFLETFASSCFSFFFFNSMSLSISSYRCCSFCFSTFVDFMSFSSFSRRASLRPVRPEGGEEKGG